VLDVAHNPPAIEQLMKKLDEEHRGRKVRFVVGMSSDKDLKMCAEAILQRVEGGQIHLVEALHPRAAKLEVILEAGSDGLSGCHYDMNDRGVAKQTEAALNLASANDDDEIIVICGSVFLMASAREACGIVEPRDSDFIAKEAGANLRQDLQVRGGGERRTGGA